MDQRAATLACDISNFLMNRSRAEYQDETPNADRYDGPPPHDEFAYATAISLWERNAKPNRAWFSTEDPCLLHFASALTLHYGLPVVTRAEGLRREQEGPTIRTVVTECDWLEGMGIINPFADNAEGDK